MRGQRALVIGTALLVALGVPGPAVADTVTVSTAKEAWYLTIPLAAPGAPPVSPYPAGSLHVGLTGGQEDSRSYVSLDLTSLDSDAEVTSGTLVLPVAPDAGTRSPEAARLRVCRAAAPEDDVEGSTAPPPDIDCSLSADATYAPEQNVFEADLEPFIGFLDGGLAIVSQPPNSNESWHVAFHGRDAEGADGISARLTVAEEAVSEFAPAPALDSESFAADIHPEAGVGRPVPSAGLGAAAAPAPKPPVARTPAAGGSNRVVTQPVVLGTEEGFRYSIIFGLPLLLLVAVPYFGTAFTSPVVSKRSARVRNGGGRAGR